MTKAAIPTVRTGDAEVDRAFAAIKQTLDAITAQSRNVERLDNLPPTATLADLIQRVNTLVQRLQ